MVLRVAVVGAGVSGLSSAVCVLERTTNVEVTVVADKFNADTLSDGAAGVIRPEPRFASRGGRWAAMSYARFVSLCHSEDGPLAGTMMCQGYLISNDYSDIESQSNAEGVFGLRAISGRELQQFNGDWKYGLSFVTVTAECGRYLPYLAKRIEALGGRLVKRHINNFAELAEEYDVVINCSGFEARHLCNDTTMFPVRGQVFRLAAPWQKFALWASVGEYYDAYIIPNTNTVVAGGVRQKGNYSQSVSAEDTAAIWSRIVKVLPGLKHAKVERQWVGLRPAREGGVRLELETMQFDGGKKTLQVIHNYGHAGSGIQCSWGCASDVTDILCELCRAHDATSSRL